jgi:hypothetical protein
VTNTHKQHRIKITFKKLKLYYIDKNMTVAQCAAKLKCSATTIYRRLRIFGLCHGVKNIEPKRNKHILLSPVATVNHDIKAAAHTTTPRNVSEKLKTIKSIAQEALKKQTKRFMQITKKLKPAFNGIIKEK